MPTYLPLRVEPSRYGHRPAVRWQNPSASGVSSYPIDLTFINERSGLQAFTDAGYGVVGDTTPVFLSGRIPASGHSGTRYYGLENRPTCLPRVLRVIHAAGWNAPENYPLTYTTSATGYTANYCTEAPGVLEPFVDYGFDLGGLLVPLCAAHGIEYYEQAMYADYGNTAGITGTPNYGADPDGTNLAPAAWLRPAIAGTQFGGSIAFGGGPDTAAADMIGGEVYNIVFATDGYPVYHGYSNFIRSDVISEPTADFVRDYDHLVSYVPRYRKYGCLVVQSPKSAQWFPRWVSPATTSALTVGTSLILPEGKQFITDSIDGAGAYGGLSPTLRSLGFDYLVRPHHMISDGDGHLVPDFTGAQVTLDAIVDKAKAFFGIP